MSQHFLCDCPWAQMAGRVEVMVENVTRFKPGDEVFGIRHGSFAKYVLAHEAYRTFKPAYHSFEEASAAPIAALSALQAIYPSILSPQWIDTFGKILS